MKKTVRTFLMILLPLSLAQAADTGVWTANSVTYSASVDNILLGSGGTANVNLSQFNTAWAAAAREGSASDFTLLYAVISLDGSIHGTINFYNNSASTAWPTLTVSGPGSQLSFGSDVTARETYQTVSLGTVGAGSSLVNYGVTSQGTAPGSVSSPNITSDLGRFLGTGEIVTVADFTQIAATLSIGNNQSGSVNLVGLANASITYYYDQAPEPSTLALLGFGCVTVLMRRRFKKTAC
jgi:hypothetical protein